MPAASHARSLPWMDQRGIPDEKAIKAPWEDIKAAIASGISFAKVAKHFAEYHPKGWQPLLEVLKKRAQREKWTVPAVAMAKARQELSQKGVSVPDASFRPSQPLRDPEKTGTLLTQSLADMGNEGSLIAGELSLSLLRDARDNADKIAPLVDTKDINATIKTLRLVAGMDKQGPVVSLNLWGDTGMSRNVPTSQEKPAVELEAWTDDE